MDIKKIVLLWMLMAVSTFVFAQTIEDKIGQNAKDPRTKENAAKADVYIMERQIKSDTLNNASLKHNGETNRKRKKSWYRL